MIKWKNNMARVAAWLILYLWIFASGVGLGAYYHTEIRVLARGIVDTYWEDDTAGAEAPITSPDLENGSYVFLPQLEEPLPLIYSNTLEEDTIQKYLREGAVVLPLGTSFGDPGNVVVTAHSSGTESFGPYRFAFAKLSELEEGDEYEIQTPTARYRYKVYEKEIVWPHEVDKLPNDDRSTVTLVTCWPLWTNFKRLLVHTELIAVDYHV